MVQATPEQINQIFYANQNKLILIFNFKRSGSEHKVHQWWPFTSLMLFWLQTSFQKVGFGQQWVLVRGAEKFLLTCALAEVWGQWRWWCSLFQSSNSKMSLASWGPQTCLLLSARSSQHVKDTGVKQNSLKHYPCCTDGELLIISLCLKGWSYERVQYVVGLQKPVMVWSPIKVSQPY